MQGWSGWIPAFAGMTGTGDHGERYCSAYVNQPARSALHLVYLPVKRSGIR